MMSWIFAMNPNGVYACQGSFGRVPFAPPFACNEKRDRELPAGLPDYCVYVTREALLGATSSLSTLSGKVRDFFAGLGQILAFDRMMRSFFAWFTPDAQIWSFAPLGFPALQARQQPQLLPYWGQSLPSLPKPQASVAPVCNFTVPNLTQIAPFYSAALSLSAAVFAATPLFMNSWQFA